MKQLSEAEVAAWAPARLANIRHVLSDGRVCYLRRPSPALTLKTGKIHRLLQRIKPAVSDNASDVGWAFLEALSDEEAEKLASQAIDLLIDVVDEPRLHRNPTGDQIGVLSLGNDFWPLYFKALTLFSDSPVPTAGGDTTVEAVESFSGGQAASAVSGNDVGEVSSPPC